MASSPRPATPFERGMALYKQREYAAAVDAFTEAIALDPIDARPYAGRALAFRRIDKDEEAMRDEKKVEELGGLSSVYSEQMILLTSDPHIHQRMENPNAFVPFVTAVDQAVRAHFERYAAAGRNVRVCCALIPGNELMLQIDVAPLEGADRVDVLRAELERMPRPRVRGGPVAFVDQMRVLGGSSARQDEFGGWFSSYKAPGQHRVMDDFLISAARHARKSWWRRLLQRIGL